MQTQNASNVQPDVPLSPVVGVHRNEMGRLSELIHNHPYGIILTGKERQTHDEIYVDVFPFSDRNIQML
jgi:hypothetical protein